MIHSTMVVALTCFMTCGVAWAHDGPEKHTPQNLQRYKVKLIGDLDMKLKSPETKVKDETNERSISTAVQAISPDSNKMPPEQKHQVDKARKERDGTATERAIVNTMKDRAVTGTSELERQFGRIHSPVLEELRRTAAVSQEGANSVDLELAHELGQSPVDGGRIFESKESYLVEIPASKVVNIGGKAVVIPATDKVDASKSNLGPSSWMKPSKKPKSPEKP